MKVYLYCVQNTFAGVVLAESKDEAKSKVSSHYIDSSDIIVVDPLDRDIMIDDIYELNYLFSYTTLKEQEILNENRIMKEEFKRVSNSISKFLN